MSRNLFPSLLAALAVGASILGAGTAKGQGPPPASAAAAPVDATTARVDRLFEQGTAAYEAGKLAEAEAAYREAWTLKRTYDVAANFGVVELKLGKPAVAAELFDFALRNSPPTDSETERNKVRARLAEARGKAGQVRVDVNLSGATVKIDGKVVAQTPVAIDLFVAPGSHTVEVTRDDCPGVSQTVEAQAGATKDVQLTLIPRSRVNRPLAATGAILGVAALAAGGVMLAVASGKGDDADAQLKQLQQSSGPLCPQAPVAGTPCDTLRALRSQHDTLHNAGLPVLVGGAVVSVATVAYALWPRPRRAPAAPATGLTPVPSIGPNGGGLLLRGTF